MFNDYSMEIARPAWQQDLGKTGRWFCCIVLLLLCLTSSPCILPPAWGDQSFAVALPELEGPVTLGIFSRDGKLVRLLYRDASVESIPAGLNGLIMNWDEKDDSGRKVSSGSFIARGIVHGPLSCSTLPYIEQGGRLTLPEWPPALTAIPLQKNVLVVGAAKDALLDNSPALSITAIAEPNACILTAEGLPILSIPLSSPQFDDFHQKIRVAAIMGEKNGSARLLIKDSRGTASYEISGLDRLVPISAGILDVKPDAFHSSQTAGESAP
jgi:hypothetical protein